MNPGLRRSYVDTVWISDSRERRDRDNWSQDWERRHKKGRDPWRFPLLLTFYTSPRSAAHRPGSSSRELRESLPVSRHPIINTRRRKADLSEHFIGTTRAS